MFSVDKCKHFGPFDAGQVQSCKKCGRMMPDLCHEQELMEEKARKFDELVTEGKAEPVVAPTPRKHRKKHEEVPTA